MYRRVLKNCSPFTNKSKFLGQSIACSFIRHIFHFPNNSYTNMFESFVHTLNSIIIFWLPISFWFRIASLMLENIFLFVKNFWSWWWRVWRKKMLYYFRLLYFTKSRLTVLLYIYSVKIILCSSLGIFYISNL